MVFLIQIGYPNKDHMLIPGGNDVFTAQDTANTIILLRQGPNSNQMESFFNSGPNPNTCLTLGCIYWGLLSSQLHCKDNQICTIGF